MMYPGKTFQITLQCHEGQEPRPVFLVKHMTGKRYRELLAWLEEFRTTTGQEVHTMPFVKAAELLAGWKNVMHPDTGQPSEFNAQTIDEVLDFTEALQIVYAAVGGSRLTEDERKK